MSFVIDIDIRNKVILRPVCLLLCPELSGLSEEEVIFLCLAYDYKSPLRRFNQMDKIRRAMIEAFGDNNPKILAAIESGDKNHRINVAIQAYKSLQYDEKQDLKEVYRNKLSSLQSEVPSKDGRELENVYKNIDMTLNRIQALENEIFEDTLREGKLMAGKENSYLEILQKNKKNYEIVCNRKPQKV